MTKTMTSVVLNATLAIENKYRGWELVNMKLTGYVDDDAGVVVFTQSGNFDGREIVRPLNATAGYQGPATWSPLYEDAVVLDDIAQMFIGLYYGSAMLRCRVLSYGAEPQEGLPVIERGMRPVLTREQEARFAKDWVKVGGVAAAAYGGLAAANSNAAGREAVGGLNEKE